MAADYIRREDALKALQNNFYSTAMDIINRVPAADVAEVVRCKGCIYVRDLGLSVAGTRYGSYFCVLNGCQTTGEDDFCSKGKRSDDNVSD